MKEAQKGENYSDVMLEQVRRFMIKRDRRRRLAIAWDAFMNGVHIAVLVMLVLLVLVIQGAK